MLIVGLVFSLALSAGNLAGHQDSSSFAERVALARAAFDPVLDAEEPSDPRDPEGELQQSLRAATVDERLAIENMFLQEQQPNIEMTKQMVAQMAAANFSAVQLRDIYALPTAEFDILRSRVLAAIEKMGYYTAQRSLKMGCLTVQNPSSYCDNILRNTAEIDISNPPTDL
jgi:hypothetical protein